MTGFYMDSMYALPYMPMTYPLGGDSYSNQVFLNDMTGLNLFTPPFNSFMPGVFPGMSMNDSLFNYNYSMPYSMPYCMPGNNTYYQNMEKYYENMMNSQISYQQKTREADITLNAAQRSLRQNGKNLRGKIVTDEQDQVMTAFNKYVESVQEYYGDKGSYEDLKNTALDTYEQQFGKDIQTELRENGCNSYLHGLKKVGTLGLASKRSAEDNIALITGQPKGKSEKYKEWAGNATAGAGLGVIGGLTVPKLLKSAKSPKLMPLVLIGAAAGWIYGRVLDLFS